MGATYEKIVTCSCLRAEAKYPRPNYEFDFDARKEIIVNKNEFQSNFIKTSKYNLLTFLPQALLLQFQRLANVYFLIISILLSIKIISPINPLTAWAPLIIVIGISMIREGYEDYQRYKSDTKLNEEEKVDIIRAGKLDNVSWSNVRIGDICVIERENVFPADLLLLASSGEGGVAYIQTASLDGQKNLKPRSAFQETNTYFGEPQILKMGGHFSCDNPNISLHNFTGKLELIGQSKGLNISGDKQFLYRGARLKNTAKIYGLVIYTGRNTKIILNSQGQSQKMSQIEIKVNYILGIVLIIQAILCLICSIGYGITFNQHEKDYFYVFWNSYSSPVDSIIIFFTYFVLLNTMIPISLIVTIEIVKMFQKYFIEKDMLMHSIKRNCNVSVQSASLNQELGQIQYIFTDKTGTLTQNLMEFKIAVIGNQRYGDLTLLDPIQKDDGMHSYISQKGFNDNNLLKLLNNGYGDAPLLREIVIGDREGKDQIVYKRKRQISEDYFIALSVAHEVVATKDSKGNTLLEGPSPDQIALVEAASKMQYEFVRSNKTETFIRIRGRERKYQVLQLFPFTSERKRMSIIIHDGERIRMFSKGADSIIKQRLSTRQTIDLDDDLRDFSRIGLRTLLIAQRIISKVQYDNFLQKMQNLPQDEKKAKAADKLIDELERQLYIIGATAVLDRLQDDVPEVIRDMIRANIKVWMLTGDKMETAENIAKSCKLIQDTFQIFRFILPQHRVNAELEQQINQKLVEMVQKIQNLTRLNRKKALLIEGSDLGQILKSEKNKKQLAKLAKDCEAVVCCRLQPIQKASVVTLVREQLNKITLAIGDGANDVPMIKAAHIGIGLYGEEGMGAVQASDYALPEFRMLWRLLFVHGRWNYIRISQMILYFFYKNMLFTLPQFIFAFFNGFSGQTIFDDIYLTLYNLIFTAMPLLIRAVLEQDVNYVYHRQPKDYDIEPQLTNISMRAQKGYLPERFGINKYFYRLFPKIYFIGQENCIFNYQNYFMWMLEGAVEAVLITLFCIYILGQTSLSSGGYSSSVNLVGLTIYSSVIVVVTFKLATHTRFWSLCLILSILVLSLGFYLIYMVISNYALSFLQQGTSSMAFQTGDCYFIVLFCVCGVLFLDGTIVFIDFHRGGYASKMREVMEEDQINNRYFYDQISLFITQGLTEADKH